MKALVEYANVRLIVSEMRLLASHAEALRVSSQVPPSSRGGRTRDETLRASAWEAMRLKALRWSTKTSTIYDLVCTLNWLFIVTLSFLTKLAIKFHTNPDIFTLKWSFL